MDQDSVFELLEAVKDRQSFMAFVAALTDERREA